MFIYMLEHAYWKGNFEPAAFRIGYYTSLELAESIRKKYLLLPGFSDHQEGFRIHRHIINACTCNSVWVVDLAFDEYCDECVEIGLFESREMADSYIDYFKSAKCQDIIGGKFILEEYQLNVSEWEEGFFTQF